MMLLSYILISLITTTLAGTIKTNEPTEPVRHSAQVKIGDEEVQAIHTSTGDGGISSIAGIASRNGRVTSYSGIYTHPGLDSPTVIAQTDSESIKEKSTDGKSKPLYITKEIDNEFTKGTVKISPGSVSVTSVSKTRSVPSTEPWKSTLLFPMMPFISGPFLRSSFSNYDPRFNPWFPQGVYGNSIQKTDRYRSNFLYPNFYPFYNNWQ